MPNEFAFEMAASSIRFGAGATSECGADLAALGAREVLVFTDPALVHLPPVLTALASLEANGLKARIFDRVRVEPNSESIEEAIAFARSAPCDAVARRRRRFDNRYREDRQLV